MTRARLLPDKLIRHSPWIAAGFGLTVALTVALLHPRPEPAAIAPASLGESAGEVAASPSSGGAELGSGLGVVTNLPGALPDPEPAAPTQALAAVQLPVAETMPVGAQTMVSNSAPRLAVEAVPSGQGGDDPARDGPVMTRANAGNGTERTPLPTAALPQLEGTLQTTEGKTISGSIELGPDAFRVTEDGVTTRVPLDQVRHVRPGVVAKPAPAPLVNGVLGTYFSSRNLNGDTRTRVDRGIDFDWGGGSPIEGIGADNFSVRWEARLTPPATGKYTFRTRSNDGIRLALDGRLVIQEWNDHGTTEHTGQIDLEAGRRYAFRLEHYEGAGTAVARLEWSPPGQPFAVVPVDVFTLPDVPAEGEGAEPPAGMGFRGAYFRSADFRGEPVLRIDPVINFDWRAGGPAPGMSGDNFSVRWTAQLTAPATGKFTFITQSDDGVRLWIGQEKVIDAWRNQSVTESRGDVHLESGKMHPLRMEYFEASGEAVVRLFWEGPSLSRRLLDFKHLAAGPLPEVEAQAPPDVAGVVLQGGSFLAGTVLSADTTLVKLPPAALVTELPTVNVALIRLQDRLPDGSTPPGDRAGVMLRNGEFVEGQFGEYRGGKVTLNSILHGRRDYNRGEVAAIVLRPVRAGTARFRVQTRSGAWLRASGFAAGERGLLIHDASLARFDIPAKDLVEIRPDR